MTSSMRRRFRIRRCAIRRAQLSAVSILKCLRDPQDRVLDKDSLLRLRPRSPNFVVHPEPQVLCLEACLPGDSSLVLDGLLNAASFAGCLADSSDCQGGVPMSSSFCAECDDCSVMLDVPCPGRDSPNASVKGRDNSVSADLAPGPPQTVTSRMEQLAVSSSLPVGSGGDPAPGGHQASHGVDRPMKPAASSACAPASGSSGFPSPRKVKARNPKNEQRVRCAAVLVPGPSKGAKGAAMSAPGIKCSSHQPDLAQDPVSPTEGRKAICRSADVGRFPTWPCSARSSEALEQSSFGRSCRKL